MKKFFSLLLFSIICLSLENGILADGKQMHFIARIQDVYKRYQKCKSSTCTLQEKKQLQEELRNIRKKSFLVSISIITVLTGSAAAVFLVKCHNNREKTKFETQLAAIKKVQEENAKILQENNQELQKEYARLAEIAQKEKAIVQQELEEFKQQQQECIKQREQKHVKRLAALQKKQEELKQQEKERQSYLAQELAMREQVLLELRQQKEKLNTQQEEKIKEQEYELQKQKTEIEQQARIKQQELIQHLHSETMKIMAANEKKIKEIKETFDKTIIWHEKLNQVYEETKIELPHVDFKNISKAELQVKKIEQIIDENNRYRKELNTITFNNPQADVLIQQLKEKHTQQTKLIDVLYHHKNG